MTVAWWVLILACAFVAVSFGYLMHSLRVTSRALRRHADLERQRLDAHRKATER